MKMFCSPAQYRYAAPLFEREELRIEWSYEACTYTSWNVLYNNNTTYVSHSNMV